MEEGIRDLHSIQKHGWSPILFEGLLRSSRHWDGVLKYPQNYGTLLNDNQSLTNENISIVVERDDKPRILELKPAMFSILLQDQADTQSGVHMVGNHDVWAFPSSRDSGAAAPPAARQRLTGKLLQTIDNVWYRGKPKSLTSFIAFQNKVKLLVYDTYLRFEGDKGVVVITNIRHVSIGKQGTDFVND
jgi:hypothetical protein